MSKTPVPILSWIDPVQVHNQAVAIERERCAKIAENFNPERGWITQGTQIAALIRKGD